MALPNDEGQFSNNTFFQEQVAKLAGDPHDYGWSSFAQMLEFILSFTQTATFNPQATSPIVGPLNYANAHPGVLFFQINTCDAATVLTINGSADAGTYFGPIPFKNVVTGATVTSTVAGETGLFIIEQPMTYVRFLPTAAISGFLSVNKI